MKLTRRELFDLAGLAAVATASGCLFHTLVPTSDLGVQEGLVHPVTHLSREEGEERLMDFANRKGGIEEAWFFFEHRDLWIDLGTSQWSGGLSIGDTYLNSLLQEIKKSAYSGSLRDMSIYHLHDAGVVVSNAQQFADFIQENAERPQMRVKLDQEYAELFALPSVPDLEYALKLEGVLRESGFSLRDSCIAWFGGIFTYHIRPSLERRYQQEGEEVFEELLYPAIGRGLRGRGLDDALDFLRDNGLNIQYDRKRYLTAPLEL